MDDMRRYLVPTTNIDSDNSTISRRARLLTEGKPGEREKAISLFYFVRDEIKYNAYRYTLAPEYFRASRTLQRGDGFCIQKAVLLAALARSAGIPARLLFADIRNYLIPEKQLEIQGGTNLFTDHGYCELHIEQRWVKATPAFDLQTCIENHIAPLEFDGKSDAILQRYDQRGKLHIEYVKVHGHYADVPLEEIIDRSVQAYGHRRTEAWKNGFWADALNC